MMERMTNDPSAVDRELPEDAPAAGPTFIPPAPQPVTRPAPDDQAVSYAPEPRYEFGAPTFDPQNYDETPLTHGYQPNPQQQAAQYYQAPGYGADPHHPGMHLAPLTSWYGRPLIDDPSGRDAPLKGASFVESYARYWKRGLIFSGRASRAEYWWVALAHFGGLIGAGVLAAVISTSSEPLAGLIMVLCGLYLLAALVPGIALTVRRLHDSNNSGGLVALSFIPYIGSFIVAILCALDSKAAGARFDQVNNP